MSDSAGETSLRSVFPVTLLVALAALAAVGPLATDTYLPAFAQMATDLKASASGIQLTMTTFLVGIAAGQLLIGMLSDRFGRRPLLVWGTLLALAAGIGTVVAPGLVTLLAARFLQGLGGAAGMVLGRAVISDRARGATATQALSVVMAIQGVAPVVAPILGGVLMDFIGWRGIMAVVAGFTLVMLLMVLAWVPESLPSQDRSSGGLKELARGTRELMRDGIFVRLVSVNALVFALLMCFLSAAPFILKNVLGMATGPYTLVFGACGLTVTVSVGIAGSLVRRVPPARQVRVGLTAQLVVDLVFAGVCLAWLGSPTRSTPLLIVVIALALAHVACLGLCFGNLPALALERTGHRAGTGSALLGFIQFAAGGLASPLVGLSGEESGAAFGVVIVIVAVAANAVALLGLQDRGSSS